MTERESGGDQDYPDGSVGRYVRERWSSAPTAGRVSAPTAVPAPRPGAGPVDAPPEPTAGSTDEPEPTGRSDLTDVPEPWRRTDVGRPGPGRRSEVGPVPVTRSAPDGAPDPVVGHAPPFSGPRYAPAPPEPGPAPPPATAGDGAPRPARRPAPVAAPEPVRPDRPERAQLSSVRLLRSVKRPPRSGWRRFVYVVSGRTINPGESPTDIARRELTARVNQPLLGCYKIAMLSLKGGVGKTTMTATLGATFASLRGDRVVAVDANPDRGTLSQKIPLETSATVRHLLRDAQRVRRYTDVRAYTSQGPSRLEVLASEQDPAVSEAFSEDDYRRTVDLLEHFYNIVLTDCGTGLMHSAMYGVLGMADQLIIVSSGSIDGARSASATMDWLDAHGHGDLVANAVAVINSVHRSARSVDLDRVEEHFAARCRAVVRVPFDAHLDEGAEIDLDRLEPGTRMALLGLAAAVADAFDRAPAR